MLSADPEDRNAGRLPVRRGWLAPVLRTLTIFLLLCLGIAFYIYGDRIIGDLQEMAAERPDPALLAIYEKFEIEPLPSIIAGRNPMASYLDMLRRESCDWNALYRFSQELQAQGYRREAAKALIAFSNKCTPSDIALQNAADIFGQLSDYDEALKVADDLIAMKPGVADYYYQRALLRQQAKKYRDAVGDFYSVMGLADNPAILNSTVFVGLAESYASLGEYCAAITPIRTWISINPGQNNTARAQALIKDYSSRENCTATYAKGSDRFPTQGKNVIIANVSINGVEGRFIVDTGASFIAVSKSFATRAKLPLENNASIVVQTANGMSQAQQTTAADVKVGHVEATDVATVVSNDDVALGPDIDGLLGRSFLSRFDVTFGSRDWRIETKE
ncbi:MAG: TIGR02281 family clan AA aspartic protease [Rhizobiaceae bacterium]|nr:TIGR02281 family clan AA aspartic protease [Rhizobiaceae bacterium]